MKFAASALAVGALLSLAPSLAQAGWSSRVSTPLAPVVTRVQVERIAPISPNFKFPTKADRVQGMPPYAAFANSPYATKVPPPPVMTPASPDPVYFQTVMGH